MHPSENGKRSIWVWILGALLPLIIFGALAISQALGGVENAVALIVAAIVMTVLSLLAKKKGINWLKQWAMGFSVLAAMVTGGLMDYLL